jgi:hypothetical protein
MRSKMKQVATTTLSGAAALQSNDIGHCRARGTRQDGDRDEGAD